MLDRKLANYSDLEKIGAGGMGVVYKAEDTRLHRTVVLKFLPEDIAADPQAKARFMQEARATSALDHPNICTIFDVGECDDGQIYLAMAYCSGNNLHKKMAGGSLPPEEALDIALQVARGLAQAHSRGIIHRDIKPENIAFTVDGLAKIIDFGVAELQSAARSGMTSESTTAGTLAYMAPEQINAAESDARADVWALGVTLYEMLTGQLPFCGDYEASLIYAILNEPYQPVSQANPDLPEQVEHILSRALAKEPADRYRDAQEMADALEVALGLLVGDRTQDTTRPARAAGRPGLWRWGLAAVAAMLFAAGVYFWQVSHQAPQAKSIAVIPFEVTPADADLAWLGSGIAESIVSQLSQATPLRVLGALQQLQIMRKLGLRLGKIPPAQGLEIARRARAEVTLTGRIEVSNDTLAITASLLHTATGKTLANLKPAVSRLADLQETAKRLAARTLQILRVMAPEQAAPISKLDAQKFYIEGLDAALDLRYDESIEKLREAIARDSTFIRPYYYLAWQHTTLGEWQQARQVLEKGRPFVDALSEEARLQFLCMEANIEHRWSDYANYLERLIKLNPYNASYQYLYGRTQYRELRLLDAGIAAMQRAVQLDSTYSYVYNTLAYAYMARGNRAAALQTVQKYVDLNPADINPLDSKAELLVLAGENDAAIALCEQILEREPDHASAPLNLARALAAKGEYGRAIRFLNRFKTAPRSRQFLSKINSLQAYCLWHQNKPEDARAALELALMQNSANLHARWLQAIVALSTGKIADGLRIIETIAHTLQTREDLENKWMLYYLQGMLASETNDYAGAISSFEKALRLFPPDRAFYLVALADAFVAANRLARANPLYREALALRSGYAPAMLGLAAMYAKQRRYGHARGLYKRFLDSWATADDDAREIIIARKQIAAFANKIN